MTNPDTGHDDIQLSRLQTLRPGRIRLPLLAAQDANLHRRLASQFNEMHRLTIRLLCLTEIGHARVHDMDVQEVVHDICSIAGDIDEGRLIARKTIPFTVRLAWPALNSANLFYALIDCTYHPSAIWVYFFAGVNALQSDHREILLKLLKSRHTRRSQLREYQLCSGDILILLFSIICAFKHAYAN